MKLIRLVFWLIAFAAIAWFATSVPLGDRSLWGHLVAIWATPEAQDLKRGTEDEAKKVAERFRDELHRDGGATRPPSPERLDDRDRRDLDRVIRSKTTGRTP